MNKYFLAIAAALFLQVIAIAVHAEEQKIALSEFSAVGVELPQDFKKSLKNLLSSRLASKGATVVNEGTRDANATVSGGYFASGKAFSIDVAVRGAAGEMLGQKYVQGNSPDDLIPAVNRLAEQIHELLGQTRQKNAAPAGAAAPAPPIVGEVMVGVPQTAVKDVSEEIVRTNPDPKKLVPHTRIDGAMLGIAPGRRLSGKEREFVVADDRHVYLYRQSEKLDKIAEYPLKSAGKILALDSADVDGDGELEIYVTIMDREELVSQVLAITNDGFAVIADRLPFFFRALSLSGRKNQVVAQQAGRGADDFYGDVHFVEKNGNKFSLGAAAKLVGKADVFTFNSFEDSKGKKHTVVIDSSGRLHIFNEAGQELWKSVDKFGGSETYFLRDELQLQNIALDRYRWKFIEKRIVITANGEIIVPQNSGAFVMGNSRSYDKNALFAYVWNGASLEEIWHTKESVGYLADYIYDEERGELVSLVQVQKEGLFSKGASVVVIKKIGK